MTRRLVRGWAVVVLLVLGSGLVGCDHDEAAAPSEASAAPAAPGHAAPPELGPGWRGIVMDFERPITAPRRRTEIARLGQGRVHRIKGLDGRAVEFVRGTSTPGAAALVVRHPTARLAVGTAPFRVAADVRLDGDDSAAGGANIVQRGLFGGASQVKLQVDGRVPSCRVAGSDGTVLVEGAEITPDRWYRLVCDRDASGVALYVARLGPRGPATWTSWRTAGATGSMDWPDGAAPLSIGAKVAADGQVVEDAPDAYAGALDHVSLLVETRP